MPSGLTERETSFICVTSGRYERTTSSGEALDGPVRKSSCGGAATLAVGQASVTATTSPAGEIFTFRH